MTIARRYPWTLAITAGALCVLVVAAGAHWSRTKPTPKCGIPCAPFPQAKAGGPILVVSKNAIPLFNPKSTLESKLFQWEQPTFAIGHCSITRPALVMYGDGTWTISLRADQNPLPPPDLQPPPFNPTAHIRRNKFTVTIRCFAAEGASDEAVLDGVGHACVVELDSLVFWVERGEPNVIRMGGTWDCTCMSDSDAFNAMDRAEMEFFFQ